MNKGPSLEMLSFMCEKHILLMFYFVQMTQPVNAATKQKRSAPALDVKYGNYAWNIDWCLNRNSGEKKRNPGRLFTKTRNVGYGLEKLNVKYE